MSGGCPTCGHDDTPRIAAVIYTGHADLTPQGRDDDADDGQVVRLKADGYQVGTWGLSAIYGVIYPGDVVPIIDNRFATREAAWAAAWCHRAGKLIRRARAD